VYVRVGVCGFVIADDWGHLYVFNPAIEDTRQLGMSPFVNTAFN